MGNEVESDAGDWVSLSDIARLRGVSPQAVWKRVRSLEQRGSLPTRRAGRERLIHLPTYDQLVAETHDPAQDLRNRRHDEPEIFRAPDALQLVASNVAEAIEPPSRYTNAVAREKDAKAALAEMQLAQKRGELVYVSEIEPAAIELGTKIKQSVDAARVRAGQLYAASKGGEEALQIELHKIVDTQLAAIAAAMSELVARTAEGG